MATKAQQLEEFIDRLGLRHFKGSEYTPYWTKTYGAEFIVFLARRMR
jgi:hypothetical protein